MTDDGIRSIYPDGMTPEDRQKHDAWVRDFLEKLGESVSGASDKCIHCGATISGMAQVGRCVYARPCGCRQYQGTVPERWR